MTSFAKLKKRINDDSRINLPNEIVLKLFDYLNISDLNKCSLVCKSWKSFAQNEIYWVKWAKIFKMDKQVDLIRNSNESSISAKDALKTILIKKKELCLLKINIELYKKQNNFTMLPDLKHFLETRFELKWYIEFYDSKNKLILISESNEKNLFESSLSVIWTNFNQSLKSVQSIKIFASIPVYIDLENGKLTNRLNSQITQYADLNSSNKMLIHESKFNFNLCLEKKLHQDSLIKMFSYDNLLIGIWASSQSDLAFITFNKTFNLKLDGKETKSDKNNNKGDLELDRNFGLHDYKVYFCFRNQTSTIFLSLKKTIHKTSFEILNKKKYLLLNVVDCEMSESSMGYHLSTMPKFTWNTEGFKKNIIDLVTIIDLNILDSNNKIMVSDSNSIKIEKTDSNTSNFVSDSFFEFTYSLDKKYTINGIISFQCESSYLSKLHIYLDLNLVDIWFGTKFSLEK